MKKPNRITRAVIDATVDRGLREVAEDPKRSIRKLADLGKQFARNHPLDEIYSMIQDLLRNDDSPYYTVIEELSRNTTRQGLKDFGINIGYHSLNFGGKLIREEQAGRNYYIPWTLTLRIEPDQPRTLTVPEVENCIKQGLPLGIYTYIIRYSGSLTKMPALLEMIASFRECSFFIFFPDQVLEPQHLELLSACTNSISLFPAGTASCEENVRALRAKKCLYGISLSYSDETFEEVTAEENMLRIAEYRSGFLILVPTDDTGEKTREKAARFCKQCRLHPKHPFITFDAEGGVREIDHIVSGNDNYVEVLENGDLRTPAGVISDFRHTIALEQILQIALPRDPS